MTCIKQLSVTYACNRCRKLLSLPPIDPQAPFLDQVQRLQFQQAGWIATGLPDQHLCKQCKKR